MLLIFATLLLSSLVSIQAKMQDMSYNYVPGGVMPRYPSHTPYTRTIKHAGPIGEFVPWAAMNDIAMGEHIGTHMDAPYHFDPHGLFINQIPLERLHGPAVVIDISERAELVPNAAVTTEDLQNWETQHGRIPDGAWIIMNSGWGKHWGDPIKFVGTQDMSEVLEKMAFPGFTLEATQWLLDNRPTVKGLAVDTVSCDTGYETARNISVHVLWLPAGKLCIENIANADKIPESGAELHALPLLLQNGTGSPTRVYATWDTTWHHSSQAPPIESGSILMLFLLTFALCVTTGQ